MFRFVYNGAERVTRCRNNKRRQNRTSGAGGNMLRYVAMSWTNLLSLGAYNYNLRAARNGRCFVL